VTREEIERAQQDTALKIEPGWNSYMAKAREEGWQKRDEEARQEKLETARRLKALDIPVDKIAAGLALSPEDLEALISVCP
jgi:predicted transposase YdaD